MIRIIGLPPKSNDFSRQPISDHFPVDVTVIMSIVYLSLLTTPVSAVFFACCFFSAYLWVRFMGLYQLLQLVLLHLFFFRFVFWIMQACARNKILLWSFDKGFFSLPVTAWHWPLISAVDVNWYTNTSLLHVLQLERLVYGGERELCLGNFSSASVEKLHLKPESFVDSWLDRVVNALCTPYKALL